MIFMIGCNMHSTWQQPRDITVRVWPRRPYEPDQNAVLRWRESGSDARLERRIRAHRKHAEIPLNSLQYLIWDHLRTDIALGERAGDAVWAGIARDDQDQWDQDHAVFFIMAHGEIQQVLTWHYNRWFAQARARKCDNLAYQDWGINSRELRDTINTSD